jgi:short-subunit dehydrogenase
MTSVKKVIDKDKFGPWAVVTGASSGIGREFARQLAAQGLNLVLVARRLSLLQDLGVLLEKEYGIRFRTIQADLAEEESIKRITNATEDLDVGLLISNAGTGRPGKFLSFGESDLNYILQLNAVSHLRLTHHFGKRFAKRRRGGVLLTGAMGAINGLPYMAIEAATKGFIQSLVKSLHTEFKEFGIHITVLITTPTDTSIVPRLGFNKDEMPMRPLSVEQCVREALVAIRSNRMTVAPGLKFRIANALVPVSLSRKIAGDLMKKNNKIDFDKNG